MEIFLPQFGLFFWTVAIFLIVFFLLKSLAWKPILQAIEQREETIRQKLAAAAEAEARMRNLTAENERILDEARSERDKMIKEANSQRDFIVNEARKQASTEADKLVANARQQIQMEKNAAIAEIRQQASDLALNIAERVIRRKLDNPEEEKKYINTLINDIKLN
jgi:F-type H+-transporting ATPase subunit b